MNRAEIELEHVERRDKAVSSGKYDYFHMIRSEGGQSTTIKGYDTYPDSSVLAGQTRINFIDTFGLEDEALMLKIWGQHAEWSSKFMEPVNTYNHLPDDGDGW